MTILSAGILLYRRRRGSIEVFLVHPGGPYWASRDEGAWSLPKGIVNPEEDHLAAARREFEEETGFEIPGEGQDLGVHRLPSGKRLHVWAVEGDCDPARLRSNCFEMEWPPKSGRTKRFAEVDRGAWFGKPRAFDKISRGQRVILENFFAGTSP